MVASLLHSFQHFSSRFPAHCLTFIRIPPLYARRATWSTTSCPASATSTASSAPGSTRTRLRTISCKRSLGLPCSHTLGFGGNEELSKSGLKVERTRFVFATKSSGHDHLRFCAAVPFFFFSYNAHTRCPTYTVGTCKSTCGRCCSRGRKTESPLCSIWGPSRWGPS